MKTFDYKIYASLTGGGSKFISDCLISGGASSYFIGANVPYDQKALENFVGGLIGKACSPSTARQMAIASYKEGLKFSPEKNVVGIGVTCSLIKKGGEREGRDHYIYISLFHSDKIVQISWKNPRNGILLENREAQENWAAHLIKTSVETFCKCLSKDAHRDIFIWKDYFEFLNSEDLGTKVEVFDSNLFFMLPLIRSGGVAFWGSNTRANLIKEEIRKVCVFPGSFNPFHDGHGDIYNKCVSLYGKENVFFEISISNFEKPEIDLIDLSLRLSGLPGQVIITNSSLFLDKIKCVKAHLSPRFEKIVFAVGSDTFDRIPHKDLVAVPSFVKFIVFPRGETKASDIIFDTKDIFDDAQTEIKDSEITKNISSSEIRKEI